MNDINPRYPAVIQSALRFLDGKGLARVQSAPLLHRLLWRMGIALPPPILAGFGTNALVQGLLFGLFWTALMWLMLWQGSERPLALLLAAGLVAEHLMRQHEGLGDDADWVQHHQAALDWLHINLDDLEHWDDLLRPMLDQA